MRRSWLMRPVRRPWRSAAAAVAWGSLISIVALVLLPWFRDTSTYGFHDWDVETSFRYLVKLSLLEHRQFPGWNPYACGGYPSWGYVEGATNLVSPWLPVYLLAPLPLAIRIETAGMALLGGVGAYAWASRFTASHGARLLVAALWAVNGRWGLQAAAGHTWHLAYAYLPWCGFFFERACGMGARRTLPRRASGPKDVVGMGASLAMLVYAGGIYPLPHTALILAVYALLLSLTTRSLQPLLVLVLGAAVGVGLSAPKLLPLLDTFDADPRLIASNERLSLDALWTLLTHPAQPFHARPAKVSPYGWHEWGMYVSRAGVLVLAIGVLFGRGRREATLKIVGVLLAALALGSFHPLAPWRLLHDHVPVFRSQHVPSRFLYPAVLVLGLVAASFVGRLVDRQRHRWRWLDLVLATLVSVMAHDIARVAQQPMRDAMWMVAPDIPTGQAFKTELVPPFQYVKRDWAGPMLLSMMANTGVLDCYGVPRPPGWSWRAAARGGAGYRGEVWQVGGGSAHIVRWSPNRVEVALGPTPADDWLVYNMHHFRGWRADLDGRATEVENRDGLIAVRLGEGARRVVLSYVPPRLGLGLVIALLTMLAVVGSWTRRVW